MKYCLVKMKFVGWYCPAYQPNHQSWFFFFFKKWIKKEDYGYLYKQIFGIRISKPLNVDEILKLRNNHVE